MTVPLAPVRDRKYWTSVIHNAAQVPPDHPRYGEARQVIQMALEGLQQQADTANARDQADAQPRTPGKLLGTAMNAFQGLTAGLGDEALGGLAGLVTLATGGGIERAGQRVQQTQEGFNEQRGQFFGEHPLLSIAGGVTGAVANPLNKVLAPVTAGMGPVATGVTYGTTLGAAQGFGESSGTLRERLPGAAVGAGAGAVAGFLTGGVIGKVLPSLRILKKNVTNAVRRMLGPDAPPAQVAQAVETTMEAAIRKELGTRLNVHPDDIERVVGNWRKTGTLDLRAVRTTPPPPPEPVSVRPGETITPIPPKDPMNTATFLRRETGRGLSTQAGGTVVRGVGGHSYTGTYPAGTAAGLPGRTTPSPAGGPGAEAMQLQQLQTLVQLPEAEFNQVAGLFPREVIDQLRVIRGQMVGGVLP